MYIGIDIGGSHVAIGLLDKRKNIIKKIEKEITTTDKIDIEKFLKDTILNAIYKLTDNVKTSDIEHIGIAVPGIPRDGKIINAYNLGIEEYDISAMLKNEFKSIPVIIKNDGICAAIAEKKMGAMISCANALFICIGTGIGGAICIDGEIVGTHEKFGFEIGHLNIRDRGVVCSCGKKGCFEAYASMKRLKRDIIKVLNLEDDLHGKKVREEFYDHKDDEVIKELTDKYLDNLVLGLASLINIVRPEMICIGGSFVHYKSAFLKKIVSKLSKSNDLDYIETIPVIKMAELGNDAGIVGSIL